MIHHVEGLARNNNGKDATFLLAAGSAGIDATRNIVVRKAWYQMAFMVYGAVALLCLITFRPWLGALVLVPALARFLLPGAHKGSVAGPTDEWSRPRGQLRFPLVSPTRIFKRDAAND